jgi:hypothetical protein
MPARKIPDRVCVLVKRQSWKPFAGVCMSKEHGHMTGAKAVETVNNGSASWEVETWTDGRNKEHERKLPVIRLTGRKRWKGVISDVRGAAPMKTMQLVD